MEMFKNRSDVFSLTPYFKLSRRTKKGEFIYTLPIEENKSTDYYFLGQHLHSFHTAQHSTSRKFAQQDELEYIKRILYVHQ